MGWQDDPIVGVRPKWESDPIVDAAPVMQPALPATPPIEIGAGKPLPKILQASANPYSAGLYPLGRKYTVGDEATFRESDILTGLEQRIFTLRVTRVDEETDEIDINNGEDIWDSMGNKIKSENALFDVPQQFSPAELQVGKKWTAAFKGTENGRVRFVYLDMQVLRREAVSVPAGMFETFRVEGYGWNLTNGTRLEVRMWLMPKVNFYIKRERLTRNRAGWLSNTVRHELVSLRQQAVGQ